MRSKLKYITEEYGLSYEHLGDAGMDLALREEHILPANGTKKAGTGICVEIPKGCFGLIVPRSSMGQKGITLANTVGIIDHQYRGELLLLLKNNTKGAIVIGKGARVAQLIILPFLTVKPIKVGKLNETKRGSDGFGSTGI